MDPYPTDSEGLAVPSRDVTGDMARFNVVVVPVLDAVECQRARTALWQAAGPQIDPSNPETWTNDHWPSPDHPFLMTDYAEEVEAFLTRAHPRLIEAFATLYRTEDLVSTIDFWGVKRPTIGHPEWRLKPLELHWDVNVSQYLDDVTRFRRRRYQALCALNQHDKAVGCFAYVPGCANELAAWWSQYGTTMKHPKYVPHPNPLHQRVTPLPVREGHVVIWDMGVAHSNTSNFSTEPRLIQFCRLLPRTPWALEREAQALPHWWQQHPDRRAALALAQPWTRPQRHVLGL